MIRTTDNRLGYTIVGFMLYLAIVMVLGVEMPR